MLKDVGMRAHLVICVSLTVHSGNISKHVDPRTHTCTSSAV